MFKSIVSIVTLAGALPIFAAPVATRPADSFVQKQELKKKQLTGAYNASSRLDLRGSWDVYATCDYLYWQPREDDLELGIANSTTNGTIDLPINGKVIDMHYDYSSGFQTGVGVFSERDDWDAYVQYTWFKGHGSASSNGLLNGGVLPFWGHPANIPASSAILSGHGSWHLSLQVLDAQLARGYYVGSKLTFRPFFGGRAAWIGQKYNAVYSVQPSTPRAAEVQYPVDQSACSWGVGPEAGVGADWILGHNICLTGSVEADLLFTRYNLHLNEKDSLDPSLSVVELRQRRLYTIRPHSDMELGLSWGSYFDNYNYHFKLFAAYGFQVFWSQNVFRKFVDATSVGKSSISNGDLFVHGATAGARFDF